MKTRQNNKAQVSLEYLIITSLLLLILIAMGIVLYQNTPNGQTFERTLQSAPPQTQ